jgi:hypothetical protein
MQEQEHNINIKVPKETFIKLQQIYAVMKKGNKDFFITNVIQNCVDLKYKTLFKNKKTEGGDNDI